MNTKKDEMVYVAPQVEVIEVQVEKGFFVSEGGDGVGNMPGGGDGWNF